MAFAGADEDMRPASASEPHKLSEVLSGLLNKIFGTADGAVFAHNEKESDDKATQDDEITEEKR
jgi:hypothetical protein